MTKPDRKEVCQVRLNNFGVCECKHRCAREQYSEDEAGEHKPGGRYSVCEIEVEELGLTVPGRGKR